MHTRARDLDEAILQAMIDRHGRLADAAREAGDLESARVHEVIARDLMDAVLRTRVAVAA